MGVLNGLKVKAALKEVKDDPEVCRKAKNALDFTFALGKIYQGNPDISDLDGKDHDAQTGTFGTEIHIDGGFLNATDTSDPIQLRALAELLVHEAFHIDGCKHPGEIRDPYSIWPFLMARACVQGTGATATTGTCRRTVA